jgi:hypothetical protein
MSRLANSARFRCLLGSFSRTAPGLPKTSQPQTAMHPSELPWAGESPGALARPLATACAFAAAFRATFAGFPRLAGIFPGHAAGFPRAAGSFPDGAGRLLRGAGRLPRLAGRLPDGAGSFLRRAGRLLDGAGRFPSRAGSFLSGSFCPPSGKAGRFDREKAIFTDKPALLPPFRFLPVNRAALRPFSKSRASSHAKP